MDKTSVRTQRDRESIASPVLTIITAVVRVRKQPKGSILLISGPVMLWVPLTLELCTHVFGAK